MVRRKISSVYAGAAIYAAGLTGSLAEGIKKAQDTIASGAVAEKLEQLIAKTNDNQ